MRQPIGEAVTRSSPALAETCGYARRSTAPPGLHTTAFTTIRARLPILRSLTAYSPRPPLRACTRYVYATAVPGASRTAFPEAFRVSVTGSCGVWGPAAAGPSAGRRNRRGNEGGWQAANGATATVEPRLRRPALRSVIVVRSPPATPPDPWPTPRCSLKRPVCS